MNKKQTRQKKSLPKLDITSASKIMRPFTKTVLTRMSILTGIFFLKLQTYKAKQELLNRWSKKNIAFANDFQPSKSKNLFVMNYHQIKLHFKLTNMSYCYDFTFDDVNAKKFKNI